ncbi:NAD(P)H:quinone oxidoreductase, type IV [Desulfocurvibacter africanus PCS]|uniref:NAD(P)H dehydrogenase (quinone) n=1 Tax=Desulfocurvibacter africanus PCS TaxID=1262666 RepID=M5PPN9_DESAF|nr:NAD(P)H:quinone oxidoreductase [Desulfocurvibacter africanus]EMG36257.1 NAD(P)H:quinone oxidoreductase, type IV [Desulfocurvibacter africanus PCS]
MKALILFYTTYGHNYNMAQAAAEGVRQVEGCEAILRRVPETLSDEILAKMGALEPRKQWEHVPVATVDELPGYDAIIFSVPTRFGNMAAQMRAFWDGTGQLWVKAGLLGKVASIMTSSNTQHGGQESTILMSIPPLLHQGMIYVGLPYTFQGQSRIDEITGCSPYGASTIAGPDGSRMPSANELDGARFQGRHVAGIAKKLAG